MKKEYIIPGLIIIVLSAYLVMHNQNRDHNILPFIPEITVSDVTEIAVEKDGQKIVLVRKDETWGVTDKHYPADQQSVSKMLDIIKELKVTALVSEESAHLNRYELDTEHRIAVTVKSKFETLRKFDIGKAVSSYRHTFVRLDGSSAVYHAVKSFRKDFDKSVDDLRNKEVLSFDKSKIKGLTLEKDGVVRELVLEESTPAKPGIDAKGVDPNAVKSADSSDIADSTDADASNAETVKVWKFKDIDTDKGDESDTADKGGAATELEKKDALDAILSTLSNLECSKFAQSDSEEKEGAFKGMENSAVITIRMEGDKTHSLELFVKDANENYPGLSSGNDYPFLLDTYQGDNLLKKLDEVLGIEETKEEANEVPVADDSEQVMNDMARQVIEEAIQVTEEPALISETAIQSSEETAQVVMEVDEAQQDTPEQQDDKTVTTPATIE